MSLHDAMAARQRFYEVLTSAGVMELDAIRVHVGLAALLTASYRFDMKRKSTQAPNDHAGMHSAADTQSGMTAEKNRAGNDVRPDWLPDHLHYHYLFQHAPMDLGQQLDIASAMVKAEASEPHLFFGYASLGLGRAQLLELMELMSRMYPKMRDGLRTFQCAAPVEVDVVRVA